jgi:hypothetical protein
MKRMLAFFTAGVAAVGLSGSASAVTPTQFTDAVARILDQPYQPSYVPAGLDSAFPVEAAPGNTTPVPNTAPAQDYTSGSIPGNPDHPNWPLAFLYVRYLSGDGAPLRARLAVHQDKPRPGVVVVHGFNTNGKESVIRWAAMLYASGYNVIASDQRDFRDEVRNPDGTNRVPSDGYPDWLQTFGWKEARDVLAAGPYLKSQPGVTNVGVMGFSLGAETTVLGMSLDPGAQIFKAGLTFSGPADQNAQIYSTASPMGCQPSAPPGCTYPVTNALVALVVPPYGSGGKYTEPCGVLTDAAAKYGTTPAAILAQEKPFHAQTAISVPLLNFYSADDSLVQDFQAIMMAGYEGAQPLQRTVEINQGEHAYFYDRWWQQKAALLYFKAMLEDPTMSEDPTVNQTPNGAKLSTQLKPLGNPTPAEADALQAPLVCPGGTTAARFTDVKATRSGGRVILRWRTASESDVLGFNVLREQGVRRVAVNRALIPARGTATGAAYSYADRRPVASARYWIEEVRLDGTRALRGPVRVRA